MSTHTKHIAHTSLPKREPSFEIDGKVIQVLRGCGVATLDAGRGDEYAVSRGTEGIHFEELRIGQNVNCQVDGRGSRVLYAHQQTEPMPLLPELGPPTDYGPSSPLLEPDPAEPATSPEHFRTTARPRGTR